MAALPYFANDAIELDVGQPGSARNTAGTARFTCRVREGAPTVGRAEHKPPQQTRLFVDHLGWAGQVITWEGSLCVTTDTILGQIVSHLNEITTGQAVDAATGVRGAVYTSKMAPGLLKDSFGRALAEEAILERYAIGGTRRISGSTFTRIVQLTLNFKAIK